MSIADFSRRFFFLCAAAHLLIVIVFSPLVASADVSNNAVGSKCPFKATKAFIGVSVQNCFLKSPDA
jgi:hypothetical protein